jgi:hypothetical protein
VIGLFKTELIKPRGPWRTAEQVELATLEHVDWSITGGRPDNKLSLRTHRDDSRLLLLSRRAWPADRPVTGGGGPAAGDG